jgi:branched-chain amino acid aminotransferase
VKALREADEIFITSTAGGIMPVRNEQVADGAPGPVTTRLRDMYWRLHEDPANSAAPEAPLVAFVSPVLLPLKHQW